MSDNRLGAAISPYLRQHADNPVDWREWGEAAFAEARERDVPVLVSIGYATCHWCHVMARESFSDPDVAAQLRADFVAVKVDREERPDVDASAMAAAGAFTEQLGWPLTVFMTPDARVFYAGTYFPPTPVGEHPSFRMVLDAVLDAWRNRRDEVRSNADAVATAIRQSAARARARPEAAGDGSRGGEPSLPAVDRISHVVTALGQAEDTTYGGFGGAPKFPSAPLLEFVADVAAGGDAEAAALLDRTRAAVGKLRDTDGGFFRYATRRDWSVPHYERMLYDNAGLLPVVDGPTARGIATFLAATLRTPSGAFAAAQDSESTMDGRRVEGDWYRLPLDERARREAPPVDGLVLTGWNGLAIRGLAIAGGRSGDDGMVRLACDAADAVIATHLRDGHVVVRASTEHGVSDAPPTIEDVGLLAEGLLELALVTGSVAYATVARTLVRDGLAGRVGSDALLTAAGTDAGEQPQTAMRSGTVALAAAAAVLATLTGDDADRVAAVRLVAERAEAGIERPLGYADALGVALGLQRASREVVAVVDDVAAGEAAAMRALAFGARRPGTVVAVVTRAQARAWADAGFELFAGRDGVAPAAYVCHDRVCALPARTAAELAAQLG